ncbi:hypothetical protein ACQVTX_17225 [Bacillus pretiosus]|uniref:hypothetical protein n=1 Tax=Bacillus pretiosus TaxID=2983392 RepID=UPI003D662051
MFSIYKELTTMEGKMSPKDRKFNSQKYFLYKIEEIFKNHHHSLEQNRTSSIQALLQDCIEINEEIFKGTGDVSRLEKSRDNLYKALFFELKTNPVTEHNLIKRDVENLLRSVTFTESKEKDNSKSKEKDNSKNKEGNINIHIKDKLAVYNFISSLTKKIKRQDIIKMHLDILYDSNQVISSFKEVDTLLDSFLNELLYEGYSLNFLDEWYQEHILKSKRFQKLTPENINIVLNIFNSLNFYKNTYVISIECWLPEQLAKELTEKSFLNFGYEFKIDEDSYIGVDNIYSGSGYYFLMTEIKACDKYKAAEKVKDALESYIDIYKSALNTFPETSLVAEKCWVRHVVNDKSEMLRTDKEKDLEIKPNKRDIENILDFINIRDDIRIRNIQSTDVLIIERAFELIRQAMDSSKENKLLNLWSALEYLLTSYPKNSIIEKARQVIPKAIALYYIKDKMNILWERIIEYKETNEFPSMQAMLICNKLFHECAYGENKYIKERFVEFLSNSYAQDLYNNFFNDIIIQREIAELNGLLENLETTGKIIQLVHDQIENDLNRIYRIRNKLVHSGNDKTDNLDVIIGRLYRYVNSLIGTIIYHKKRNSDLNLTEILFSLVQTYDWYINYIKEPEKQVYSKTNIAFPKYLFI